ncbi:MAG: hypothetical protein ACP5HG_13670 [Anaerolineae bacterium]
MRARRLWWLGLIVILLAGYWLIPISGRVLVTTGDLTSGVWPRFELDDPRPDPGTVTTVRVSDVHPWTFVNLVVGGTAASSQGRAVERAGTWTWTWTFTAPSQPAYDLVFYRDCHTGCVERGRIAIGVPETPPRAGLPTKLGVVMPRLDRDWHGRRGWAVEITYALQAEEPYWGVDDLAERVARHHAKGLRVLVRVEYEQRQSLPPTDDYVALAEYLEYFRRLARDERLVDVYGYIVGSDYNTLQASVMAPDRITTPAWYARVFNGYGDDVTHSDNVVQVVRAEHSALRVLIGPLRPWSTDQDGELVYEPYDVPWLNYLNTLVAYLDEAARAKEESGIPFVAPDGIDVQAPGCPDAPEMAGQLRSDEPQLDLRRADWEGARVGFGVYRDCLDIVNAYPTTRGLPAYIVSTNTYDRAAGIPPAQNYPRGWLTTALGVANEEPQIKALVWFLDEFPHGDDWDWFSLTEQPGRLVDAAEEFDALLQGP